MLIIKIGLIGSGTIGMFLIEKINQDQQFPQFNITAVFDEREKSIKKLDKLAKQYQLTPFHTLTDFLASDIDIVVECASISAVRQYAMDIVRKKHMLVISIGALVDRSFYSQVRDEAKRHGKKIYLPSGAIGGIDLIQAANVIGGLESVTLTTRKPATALLGKSLDKAEVLFEGSAEEAIVQYPKNINVSIILSLAGLGVNKTNVQMIADPAVDKNIHTITARGEFGEFELKISNNPLPGNPNTSYLTTLSILSTLQSVESNLLLG